MSISLNYIFLHCFFWCLYVFPWSFTVLYLSRCGLSATQIGFITGASSVLAIIVQPLTSALLAKSKRLGYKFLLVVSALIFIIFGVIMIFNKTETVSAVSFLTICTLASSVPFVMSTVCMEYVNNGIGVNYGVARGLGSISYAVFALVFGQISNVYGIDAVVPIYTVSSILFLIVILIMKMPEKNKRKTLERVKISEFVRDNKKFMVFIAASVMLFISHFMINSFLINKINAVGGNSFDLGISLFISAAAELPVMAFIVKLIKKFGIDKLIIISGVFFAIKAAIILLSGNIWMVYFSQLLQFGAFAVYTPASVYYTNIVLEDKYRPMGQAFVGAATLGLGAAMANVMGGTVVDMFGVDVMLALSCVFAAVGCAVMFTVKNSLASDAVNKRNL